MPNRARLCDRNIVRHALLLAMAARTSPSSSGQENGFGRQSKARSHLARRAVASSKMPDTIMTGSNLRLPVDTV
jgi:hypothetical protein